MSLLKTSTFLPSVFLAESGIGRAKVAFKKRQVIFHQGDPGTAVFYIQRGSVKLTVLSEHGKEATIALLNEEEFVGEECISGIAAIRVTSASAVSDCSILKIEKREMIRVLHEEHSFSDAFVSYMLARNSRTVADLIDQLFSSAEKRLARALLLLAQYGKTGKPETMIASISQETLAEMIGTTRSRVNFFMSGFRKRGFIEYGAGRGSSLLKIHSSLLSVVLHEQQ